MGGASRTRWAPFAAVGAGLLLVLASGGNEIIGAHAYAHMLRFGLVWIGCIALVVLFPRSGFTRRCPPAMWILLLAVLARSAILPMPVSDDTNRYLWEGHLVAEGINPYLHAPDDPALAPLARTDPFHAAINHPDMPAAYPPLTLTLFAAVGKLAYSPWAMKILVVAFDLASLILILKLLDFRKLGARWALLYALNPVVLYAFAGEAHFDAIQNFFLLAALVAFDRRRWGWMFLAAGLAIQSKYVAVVAVPFLLRRDNLKWAWIGVLTVLLPFLPFLRNGPAKLFDSIVRFGENFAYNGSVHSLLRHGFDEMEPATTLCKGLLLAGLVGVFAACSPLGRKRFHADPVTGMLAAWLVLLVFAPTVHYWYVAWLIPLLPLRPLCSGLLLSLTICGVFVTNGIYHDTGEWILPGAVQVVEWTPVLLLLLYEAGVGLRRLRVPDEPLPQTLSVIIPTHNEGEWIGPCIQSFRACTSVEEVVVVDAGSQDNTAELARMENAIVLEAGGGRGGQILAGLEQACGDVVVVVHADSLVPPALLDHMLETLRKNPDVVGGALGAVFSEGGGRLHVIEFLNDFRAAFMGIGFGDQVQFFRRRTGMQNRVFIGIPLMEDVELSLRLGRVGRRVHLFGDAVTSSRHWEAAGTGRATMIIRLVCAYCWLRLWRKADAGAMYRKYYGIENQPS